MKKILTVILALTMIASLLAVAPLSASADVWDGTVATAFAGGDGSAATPYQIANAKQLAYFSSFVNSNVTARTKSYILTADITLNEGDAATWGETAPANAFTPVGKWDGAFGGTFDGNGKTISGLYVKSTSDSQGMFGCIQGGAVIKNFALVNSYVESTNSGDGCTGGVVGQTNRNSGADITIEKIYCDAIVVAAGKEVGGIIGNISGSNASYTPGDINITNVVFAGSVTTSAGNFIGGILGNGRDATINLLNCANYGTVTGNGSHQAGLIALEAGLYSIENCISAGTLPATSKSNVCAIAVGTKAKADTDGERSIVNTYYVDGIAEDGATKNADSNDGITKLTAISALVGAQAEVSIDTFTKRAGDIMIPTAIAAFAPSTSSKWDVQYTVTWCDEDGTVLETETYSAGDMPEYKGETPTKASDENFTYTFYGWDPEVKVVLEDATYTAKYFRQGLDSGEEEEESTETTKKTEQTTAPATTTADTAEETKEGGCGSAIGGVVAMVSILGMGAVALRKKDN